MLAREMVAQCVSGVGTDLELAPKFGIRADFVAILLREQLQLLGERRQYLICAMRGGKDEGGGWPA